MTQRHLWRWMVIGLLLACGVARGEEPMRVSWSWYMEEQPDWYPQFKDAGFNTVALGPRHFVKWWEDEAELNRLRGLVDQASAAGLDVLIKFMWSNDVTSKLTQKTVTRKGTIEDRLPSPVSDELWQTYLIPCAEAAARLAKEKPAIRGILIDTEQYQGKETSGGINEIYCFGDESFARFLKAKGMEGQTVEPAQRGDWLEQKGLLADYYALLEKRAEDLAREQAQRVRAIAPNVGLHFYLLQDSWFYRGLIRGWAHPGTRLYVFDERTYDAYLPMRGQEVRTLLAKLNPDAVWCPGIYTQNLSPRAFRLNLKRMVADGVPMWIYNQKKPYPPEVLEALKEFTGGRK